MLEAIEPAGIEAVLEASEQAALEDHEKTLCRVGVGAGTL